MSLDKFFNYRGQPIMNADLNSLERIKTELSNLINENRNKVRVLHPKGVEYNRILNELIIDIVRMIEDRMKELEKVSGLIKDNEKD